MQDFFEDLDSELQKKPTSGDKKPTPSTPSRSSTPTSRQPARAGAPRSRPAAAKKPAGSAPRTPSRPTQGRTPARPTSGQGTPSSARPRVAKKAPTSGDSARPAGRRPVQKKGTSNDSRGPSSGGLVSRRSRVRSVGSPTTFPRSQGDLKLPPLAAGKTRIMPIGGLKTVGANMTMVEHDNEILLIDGGLGFAGHDVPGADYLMPDIRFLVPLQKKVVGMLVTHGHLDHIGALKNIIPALGFPKIYGAPFTIAMIKKIFEEHGLLNKTKFVVVNPDNKQIATVGKFKYEFFRVNHTVPDSCWVYVETKSCRLMHMGDYKVDFTPVLDKPTDLANFARIASRKIDVLLQETTNSTKKTWTTTETVITEEIDDVIREAKDRVIIGNFSSLISRIQEIVKIAEKYGKFIFINGRSMVNHVAIAREMGYIKCKTNTIKNLDPKTIKSVPPSKQIIITTGAQGEEFGGLALMGRGDHRVLNVSPRDTIVFSSSVIPGNEVPIIELKNQLIRYGAKVVTIHDKEVHAGGHGGILEQKVVVNVIRPRYILPVHGDISMRFTLKRELIAMGWESTDVPMLEDGAWIEFDSRHDLQNPRKKLQMDTLVVDGQGIGVQDSKVIKDRIQLRDAGVLVVNLLRNKAGDIQQTTVDSRGLFYTDEIRDMHTKIQGKAQDSYTSATKAGGDAVGLERTLTKDIEKYLLKLIDREPAVVVKIVG